jgi:hypothetical protein
LCSWLWAKKDKKKDKKDKKNKKGPLGHFLFLGFWAFGLGHLRCSQYTLQDD